MIRKLIFIIVLFFIGIGYTFFLASKIYAQNNEVNLYLFWSATCPHCKKELAFLDDIKPKYEDLKIHAYELSSSQENVAKLQLVGKKLNIDVGAVPMTIVGKDVTLGFGTPETTGVEIESNISKYLDEGDPDIVGDILSNYDPTYINVENDAKDENEESQFKVNDSTKVPDEFEIPIIGPVQRKDLSLPALTLVIAFIDGFNPCAMWVLLYLIMLLLGMKNEFRRWILGFVFIFTSGLIYFVILAAWLNIFLAIGYVKYVQIFIGLLSTGIGIYYLCRVIKDPQGGCDVVDDKNRNRVLNRLKEIAKSKSLLASVIGIITVAVAVNVFELLCSAGLPAVYTQILSNSDISSMKHYLYLTLYVFVFMIDDILLFIIAMITLKVIGIENKYTKFVRIIGGIIMFLIGLAFLFKPSLVMF